MLRVGAEVPFVFGDPFELSSDAERNLSRNMGCFWVNFASTGNPNVGPCPINITSMMSTNYDSPGINVDANNPWPAFGNGSAIAFGNTSISIRTGLKSHRCDLYRQYP